MTDDAKYEVDKYTNISVYDGQIPIIITLSVIATQKYVRSVMDDNAILLL
jgi:hypothetical protein